jgi:hypothetical protein
MKTLVFENVSESALLSKMNDVSSAVHLLGGKIHSFLISSLADNVWCFTVTITYSI